MNVFDNRRLDFENSKIWAFLSESTKQIFLQVVYRRRRNVEFSHRARKTLRGNIGLVDARNYVTSGTF